MLASKALGVDYGSQRVGVAIGGGGEKPRRLRTLTGGEDLEKSILKLAEENEAGTIVVGLPRNLDGEDTAQTRVVRQFVDRLAKATSIPVVTQDEAVTSELAAERLKSEGIKKPKTLLDQEAAVIVLEDYLHESR